MSTIGNQLNILRDTQMVQRRRLEKMFPYIEWDRMPFSSYNDFFLLRGIIDDCGAVWTNAYGRSNTEPDGQRNFLEDYSGNGRDIELFNFGYSLQSGFNGYVQDFRNSGSTSIQGSITESKIDVTNIAESASTTWIVWLSKHDYINAPWKVYAEFDAAYAKIIFTNTSDYHTVKNIDLQNGKITEIPALTEEELADYNQVAFAIPKGGHLTLTQIAPYQGAIVGDGIDDYGQCVKDFALPDDYTVVAMREHFDPISASPLLDYTSFVFERNTGNGWQSYSFTDFINIQSIPVLFSWQTKDQFNGVDITEDTGTDITERKLSLFHGAENYAKAALYSFGIFTRTLTEEELRIVENCMYAEWIAMTGKLDNIEYYDILDARFRSNEEDAEKRNRWVGRLGKLHMSLNNYAYSEMSGWNGWPTDWESWNNVVIPQQGGLVEVSKSIIKVKNFGAQPTWTITSNSEIASIPEMRIKISGLKTGASLFFIKQVSDKRTNLMTATGDGIYTVPADTSAPDYYGIYCNGYSANEDADLTIELLPDYGGALVSDGVDDYAVSDEVIDEEIGGVVVHGETIRNGTEYFFNSGTGDSDGISRRYAYHFGDRKIHLGAPDTAMDINLHNIYSLNMEANIPNTKIFIQSSNANTELGQNALYQLRLIKTQPTDIQLEAIKWQCRKEHDDYLVHMGWKDDSPGWYGVEWDMTDPSPDLKRIGNMQMHRDLPVHVQMRGCLLNDDGVVQKYLDPDDWTSETLDGSAGQVMVQAPVDSYWRFEKDGNICRAKFSPTALPGFKRTPQGFLGSEEATVQRSTNKLCSVVNEDADYRGGNNNSAWDGTYRSLLGMPATAISRTNFRTYARNRKSGSTEWNMNEYDLHKLLYWLAVVQYATFNLQKTVNTEKDADGFSQGGLGSGVTTLNYNKWVNFNSVYPFIPCGLTASLGNGSGQVAFTMPFEYDAAPSSATGLEVPYMGEYSAAAAYTNGQFVSQGEELYECTADASAGTALTDTAHFTKVTRTVVYANRYLGVALPFGHIWKLSDGVNFRISADTSAGGDGRSQIFTCSDPAKFSDQGYDGYRYIGDAPRANGYVKGIVFGEDGDIVPISTGGSSTTYFCDYWYTAIPDSGESLRGVLFGGNANYGANAGLACANSFHAPSASIANFGSRLCFIPA